VIYLWFDRLALRARAWRERRFGPSDDGDHGGHGGASVVDTPDGQTR